MLPNCDQRMLHKSALLRHLMMIRILLLIICLVLLTSCNPGTTRGFANLVDSLKDDDSVDMEELLGMEDVYNSVVASHEGDAVYSEIELLLATEDEEVEDEEDQNDVGVDPQPVSTSGYPGYRNWGVMNVLQPAFFQGKCGSCGWISGTQTLEARVAIVSENYIPYSIQNFMNCVGKVCTGAQPYSVNTQAMKSGNIVPKSEIPYSKKACQSDGSCGQICGSVNPYNYTNALHDQHVVIVGTKKPRSFDGLMAALQDGPVTTCFNRNTKQPGEVCGYGCGHANSIIGYSADDFLIRENYGKKWGPFKNGTWVTPKHSDCAGAVTNKAAHPKVLYDLDRANAFYTEIVAGVAEVDLTMVDKDAYNVTENDIRNWGLAKNKCAFLGAACAGVVATASGSFELVHDFGARTSGPSKAFRKTQMVIYLKHEQTGKYIGIKITKKQYKIIAVDKNEAAPFFTSYARLVSFDYPLYHLVNNKLIHIQSTIRDVALEFEVEGKRDWYLDNCMIHNEATDKVLDLTSDGIYLTLADMDKDSVSQRFRFGVSGSWELWSMEAEISYHVVNYNEKAFALVGKAKGRWPLTLRWHGREIMSTRGYAMNNDLTWRDFNSRDATGEMTPTDCRLSNVESVGNSKKISHLVLKKGKIKMSTQLDDSKNGWTFEYADM